jgi:hypothetical protein
VYATGLDNEETLMFSTHLGMRAAVAAAAIGVALVGVPASHAEPFAGKVRSATADFKIQGADKVLYRVIVTLQSAASAAATEPVLHLQVAVAPCSFGTCGKPVTYASKLAPQEGAIADDMASASVTTTFAGLPVKLSWSGESAVASPNVDAGAAVSHSGVAIQEPGGGDAGASGVLFGVKCFGEGSISGAVVADATTSPTPQGLKAPSRTPKAFAASGGSGPSCVKG